MKMPPLAAQVLKTVAPTLAGALAGPFGVFASRATAAALEAWLPTEVTPAGGAVRPPSPQDVVVAVERNSGDAEFRAALKRAEADLIRAGQEAGIRFAEIDRKDRENARAMSRDTGLARPMFYAGMFFVGLTVTMLFGIVVLAGLTLSGTIPIDAAQANIAPVVYSTIGTVVTALIAVMTLVLSFYYGSSAGSKDKTDQIGIMLGEWGQAVGDAAAYAPPPVPAAPPVVVLPPAPAPPAAPAVEADADWQRGPHGGVRWRLTADGVVLEGRTKPERTVGVPATVRRIWAEFGPVIAASCAANAVPLELVVATIATESAGRPRAVLIEPDERVSVGLMQTLTGTASGMMGREVTAQDLNDPALSIEAGTRYIASQRPKTKYQPPLVAAAYNAGSLRPARAGDDNPFNLTSTGDHILRFLQFFGDAVVVAREDKWQHPRQGSAAG